MIKIRKELVQRCFIRTDPERHGRYRGNRRGRVKEILCGQVLKRSACCRDRSFCPSCRLFCERERKTCTGCAVSILAKGVDRGTCQADTSLWKTLIGSEVGQTAETVRAAPATIAESPGPSERVVGFRPIAESAERRT